MFLAKAYDDYIKVLGDNSLKTLLLVVFTLVMIASIAIILAVEYNNYEETKKVLTKDSKISLFSSIIICFCIFIFGSLLIIFIATSYGEEIIMISPNAKYEDVDKYWDVKTKCHDGTYTATRIKQFDDIKEDED